MFQKLPVDGFKWRNSMSSFSKNIIMKILTKDAYLKSNVEYPKNLHDSQSDLPFLPKRMKIKISCKLLCDL